MTKKLKAIRKEKGLTQKELADASGVSLRTLQHYEQGSKDFIRFVKADESLGCGWYVPKGALPAVYLSGGAHEYHALNEEGYPNFIGHAESVTFLGANGAEIGTAEITETPCYISMYADQGYCFDMPSAKSVCI